MTYNEDLCKNKHLVINERFDKMEEYHEKRNEAVDRKMDTVINRLNWFYVIAIATLASSVTQLLN